MKNEILISLFYRSDGDYWSSHVEYNNCIYVNVFDRHNYQKMEIQILDRSNKAIIGKYSYESKPVSVITDESIKQPSSLG